MTEVDVEMGVGMQMLNVPRDEVLRLSLNSLLEAGLLLGPFLCMNVHGGCSSGKRLALSREPGSEIFDRTFLGTLTDGPEIATGFGGTVRKGFLTEHEDLGIVTKELVGDDDGTALFKELYTELMVASSPYVGLAVTEDQSVRLVSSRMPRTVAQNLGAPGVGLAERKHVAISMLSAVACLADLGLAHCDLKPDNFLMSATHDIFFASSTSELLQRRDPRHPVSCGDFHPPDSTINLKWDVYSLGVILQMVFDERAGSVAELSARMCHEFASERPPLHTCFEIWNFLGVRRDQ